MFKKYLISNVFVLWVVGWEGGLVQATGTPTNYFSGAQWRRDRVERRGDLVFLDACNLPRVVARWEILAHGCNNAAASLRGRAV